MSEDRGHQTTSPETDADSRTVTVGLPLWICLRTGQPQEILGGTLEGGLRFVTIFVSKAAAEANLGHLGLSGMSQPIPIPKPDELVALLADLIRQGCQWVVIHDERSSTGDTGLAIEIDQAIESIRGTR